MTTPLSRPPSRVKLSWGDSPWPWLFMFAAAAVLGLLAIAPKYNRREARLERAYQAREQAAYGTPQLANGPSQSGEREPPPPRIVPWQTLAILMGLVLGTLAAGLIWHTRRAGAGHAQRGEQPT